MKYPGLVTVEFLDPIDPGLDRKSFMATLKNCIEDRMEILEAPYVKNEEKA
jgi:1-acyl-sn-glycerol-3-phosphate acyltransferase